MKKPKLTVKQNDEAPVATEILAQSIVDISNAMERISRGPLKKRALLVLIRDASNVSLSDIEKVLNALEDLKRTYTK